MAMVRGRRIRRVLWKDGERPGMKPIPPPSHGPLEFNEGERELALPGTLWVANKNLQVETTFADRARWIQPEAPYLIPGDWRIPTVPIGTPVLYMGDVRVEETVRFMRALVLVGTKRYIVADMRAFSPVGAKVQEKGV